MVFRFACAAIPIILVDVAKLLLPALTVMRAGRQGGPTALAAASLGSLCFNVAGNMVVYAPLNVLDSVAPQAFGAGDRAGVGLAAQRAVLLSAAFLAPTLPLWHFAEAIMVALGQPADVATLAAPFMRLMFPALFGFTLFEALRKFLYAQACVTPPLLAAAVGLASHFAWLELLVGWLDWLPNMS